MLKALVRMCDPLRAEPDETRASISAPRHPCAPSYLEDSLADSSYAKYEYAHAHI